MRKWFAVVLLCFAPGAFAADARGSYGVFGHGADYCDAVLKARQHNNADYANISSWVNGYFTAVNAYKYEGKDIMKNMKLSERMDWIGNYCRKNPLRTLASAVHALFKEQNAAPKQ